MAETRLAEVRAQFEKLTLEHAAVSADLEKASVPGLESLNERFSLSIIKIAAEVARALEEHRNRLLGTMSQSLAKFGTAEWGISAAAADVHVAALDQCGSFAPLVIAEAVLQSNGFEAELGIAALQRFREEAFSPLLTIALRHEERETAKYACECLCGLKGREPTAAEVSLVIEKALEPRISGRTLLKWIAERNVELIIDAWPRCDTVRKRIIACALSAAPKKAAPAAPHLLAELKSADVALRGDLIAALARIGSKEKDFVDLLVTYLQDDASGVQGQAAWALGEIGHFPDKVVRALAEGLSKPGDVGKESFDALERGERALLAEALPALRLARDEGVTWGDPELADRLDCLIAGIENAGPAPHKGYP